MKERISWDEYFINLVDLVLKRSPCFKKQVGAVIVKDNQILSTGYNGPPIGVKHCEKCDRINMKPGEGRQICRSAHAEQNAIALAAKKGISINGATMYTNYMPCSECSKLIVNSGITTLKYRIDYKDELNTEILEKVTKIKLPRSVND